MMPGGCRSSSVGGRRGGVARFLRWALAGLGLSACWGQSRADTHYVGGPWPGGPFPYTSPETAAYYAHEAIDAAESGDLVVFFPRRYGGADRPISMKAGVRIAGSGPESTFFMGDVSLATGVEISGVRFVNNVVFLYDLSAPGPVGVNVADCVFDGAWIEWIQPEGQLDVRRCLFLDTWHSHAIVTWSADVTLSHCAFLMGPYSGAGGIAFSDGHQLDISQCVFNGCSGAVSCDGATRLHVTHSTLLNDTWIALSVSVAEAVVENCTFFRNKHALGVGHESGKMARARNCILWGSKSAHVWLPPDSGLPPVDISFSNVEGGYPGQGNIDADPMFFLPSAGEPDLHLCAFSPCIDAGDPFSDYSNEPEPNGGRINMGAYGGTWEATTSELVDSDGDNLRDDWEMEHFGTLDRDGMGDADGDSLSDRDEYRYLANPNNPDTDGDDLQDREEAFELGTNPTLADTDNDGTPDGKEVGQGTDPLDPWDAFTIIKFWVENGQIHVVHPVQPRCWYELQSSFFPGGPFGIVCPNSEGRFGVPTHTFVVDVSPFARFYRIEAHPY